MNFNDWCLFVAFCHLSLFVPALAYSLVLIQILKKARQLGDFLLVGIYTDQIVR